ncbi:potassium/proton antiporter [Aureibacter tunicatorum]|uniref:Cell volume regulation protein A n=1 Tax=Aureibacter tunicatorum TaxID=866807 RepID=A0AAE4BTQ5_9BACT|nr:potassium/proton antiporter [Aureibacter tunicatorum]MDR6239892.1 cell volume regulation protein A [Aureibacter tunicatorum]BDD04367.1 K+/H+ antiporter [Aureibacter tunicatorum]
MAYTDLSLDSGIILISILVVFGILIYNPAKFLGIPSFIIFMGIGLFLGNGDLGDPVFDDPQLTELLSGLALNIIIFDGGFNTSIENVKTAYKEGMILSTVGVLITAALLGGFTWLVTDLPLMSALIFGAVVSSTDAAAVFGILEARKLKLKHKTGTILEFESATNDPMALVLVTVLTSLSAGSGEMLSVYDLIWTFIKLIVVGLAIGIGLGLLTKIALDKISFQENGLIPIFTLCMFFIATYGSKLLDGNILISSYVFGLIIGNGTYKGRELNQSFNNSISWMAQALMFLFLGLQIFPDQLIRVFFISFLPAIFLILAARPLATYLCYLPFKNIPYQKKLFIAMIGLKGATPIVFAFIPLVKGVPNSPEIFNMVFYIVMYSIIIQGALLDPLAKKLSLKI